MKHFYCQKKIKLILFFLLLLITRLNYAQNFSQSNLNFNGKGSVDMVTSLMYGPDGRLYLTEYKGLVKILTIERVDNSNYVLTEMETLNHIQTIQNHNDDGSSFSSTFRETTGITVAGTASNPIIYVTSSDFRIGGGTGGGGGDVGLDTNSGIITRFTWNGSSWDAVDIVRGLPRSEENHGTHGIEFTKINGKDFLIVCSGGNTNGGSPSKNFTYLTEYALSSSILSINLSMIESMPIQNDNGRNYIYDIPTLDDPTRANKNGIEDPNISGYNGIDINDPFGGNDGLNQGKIVPGGPVQIFSPGYRNSYDLVVTESGSVYATENGANGGWGGFPENEGTNNVTNNYISSEPGSSSASGGEQINNEDQLHLITTDIQNYTFGSLYGGHPNPVRANPAGAGLFTAPAQLGLDGAVFRTQLYDPDGSTLDSTTDPDIGLPADWPPLPVSYADPSQGDWRGPGQINPDGPNDSSILIWGTNTNAIDEYTASNFGGIMKGNLLAGTNTGVLRRVELNSSGTVENFTSSFISGLGGNALGVTCNSDSDIFPGTIWVGNFNNIITVIEPQDFVTCLSPTDIGYEANADYDNDEYSNQDEVDNFTDPCNGGSQPADFDKSIGGILVSDLNDTDDDADGILDVNDPFQLGNPNKNDSDAFILPVINELFSNTFLGGYLGLGMTGMMNNGDVTNGNWLNWLDRRDDLNDPNPNDILGGAIGAMTMEMTSGTALGTQNNQEKAFQYGIQVDQNTGLFTISGTIVNFNQPLQLYGNSASPDGELGFFIGDGTQSNYIKFVARKQGIRVQQEINDIPQTPIDLVVDTNNRPNGLILFSFIIDPTTGEIILEYTFDDDTSQTFGTITAQGLILDAIQQTNKDLAIGFIGTSNAIGVELEGTWGVLNVTKDALSPIIVNSLPNQYHFSGETIDDSINVIASGGDGSLTYSASGLPAGIVIDQNTGSLTGVISLSASNSSPYDVTITVDDSDGDNTDNVLLNFTWTVTTPMASTSVVRINTGGNLFTATDSGVNWQENTTNGSYIGTDYSVNSGNGYANGISNLTRDSSIPDYIDNQTFNTLFATERYDNAAAPEMEFNIPLPDANYLINLYFCNAYDGINSPGGRVFDIAIEDDLARLDLDLVAEFGHQVAGMLSFPVTISDGELNIEFLHGIDNPLINAIEIRSFVLENQILVNNLSNQTNTVGDTLDGSLGVIASGGDGNLTFSATGLPSGVFIEPTNGQIGGSISSSDFENSPYNVTITVDDSDTSTTDAVNLNFTWIIYPSNETPLNSNPLYRINTGGPLLAGTDSDINWEANTIQGAYTGTSYSVNTGNVFTHGVSDITRHESIPDYIDTTTFNTIFNTERYDNTAAPEMEFTFTVPNAYYLVNIYMSNTYNSINAPGERIFDIAMEGSVVRSNLDLVAEFGYRVATMLSFPITVSDGVLNIEFLHSVVENPLVNAIEIRSVVIENPIVINNDIVEQFNNVGDTFDGNLAVIASGGDGDLSFTATNLPPGLNIDPITGSITGTITSGAETNSPYNVTITIDDSDIYTNDTITLNFNWSIIDSNSITPLYRINTGGPLLTATDSDIDWEANTTQGAYNGTNYSVNTGSPYTHGVTNITRHESIPDYIDTATFNTIFNTERYDNTAAPEMEFTFTVPNAYYIVNIYMSNTYNGIDGAGERVFDIALEDNVVRSNLDLVAEFGHRVGVMLSFPITVSDGVLNIEFLHSVVENPLVNAIEIRGIFTDNSIIVENFQEQYNIVNDTLDGSLAVIANGGDGDLSFIATNLPPGLTIDSVTGSITGTITSGAETDSPYDVTVTIDDSDIYTNDVVTLNFNWIISTGDTPIITETIANQSNNSGDTLDGSLTAIASGGDGNLVYTAAGLPEGLSIDSLTGSINGTISYFADTHSPYNVTITIDDSDTINTDAVTLNFIWTVTPSSTLPDSNALYRINTGGPLLTATDSHIDWEANTTQGAYSGTNYSVNTGSPYTHGVTNITRHESIPDYIDTATFNTIFNTERYDNTAAPEMEFTFTVPNADYFVNIFMSNTYNGIDGAGERVFDIALEDNVVRSNLDLVAEFGHRVGVMLSFPITVSDGVLNIEFLHSVVENPLVNAIEIKSISTNSASKSGNSKNKTLTVVNPDFESEILEIILFPNPANNETSIRISDENILLSNIDIYDISGRLIRSYNTSEQNTEKGLYKINISGIQEGTYIINLRTPTKNILSHKKLIIK
ncbi:Por secretion system C-terminal sorting domain-containing protein [Flaviramulus basaltis]|uniref:Por secretion system C-terminal sorting domain-containing protein n=1 Tax=Flaviramulus basaltis TaxID=369401 RepID=A0A1K2IP24_9FLAO|nr:malectin domain-containing carbohydrate-binding protein [Flaviramulus basaltis]SFZ94054.1 Por secretion system C-terminal sorting domain-containing protein [Flaviramulus basaltis]